MHLNSVWINLLLTLLNWSWAISGDHRRSLRTGYAPSHIYWLHYLDSKVGAKIYFPANRQPGEDAGALQERCNELVRDDKPEFLS